jgi:hypothetical protein
MSGMVRQLNAVLAGLVSTDRPSMATWSSRYSIPASPHRAISSSLIGRLASEMSVSPEQNSWKPSPVPGPSTVTATPWLASENCCPTRALIGSTVDEPEMAMLPLRPPSPAAPVPTVASVSVVSSSPPQAARTIARARTRSAGRLSCMRRVLHLSLGRQRRVCSRERRYGWGLTRFRTRGELDVNFSGVGTDPTGPLMVGA